MTGFNLKMLVAQIVGLFVVFALALFIPAGTLNWSAGWAFLILFFGFTVVLSYCLLKNNPGLLTERMTGIGKADQKGWDKIFFVLASVLFYGWLIFMALDAMRFHWSQVPGWLQVVGALVLLASFPLFFLTFRENSFLSPAVRVQEERGQTVISTGPYHYVRHPMYAAFLLYALGTCLLLGSWYGLIVALLLVIVMARRAIMEENTLRAELQGYESYMGQVRYRLIPGVW
jgi:protein-S-isoprenylcysteine O-methyltransferase Ste14